MHPATHKLRCTHAPSSARAILHDQRNPELVRDPLATFPDRQPPTKPTRPPRTRRHAQRWRRGNHGLRPTPTPPFPRPQIRLEEFARIARREVQPIDPKDAPPFQQKPRCPPAQTTAQVKAKGFHWPPPTFLPAPSPACP